MALTVDWNTYVITVPQADLTPLDGGIYELDMDWFKAQLKSIEASEDGIDQPDTHVHATQVVLSGVTYARFIIVTAPYSIEFEDGQYAVKPVGANHNIQDVKVLNQVSLLTQNSAGLIVASGSSAPTQQEIRDALKLAPTAGAPAVNSIDDQLRKQRALGNAILGSVA